jgi:hypothetical protein
LQEVKKIPHADREKRKALLTEAKDNDRIAKEFLNQGMVQVTFPNLGEQSARYSIMNKSPESEKTTSPIVIIPGISNDLDSIEAHAQSVARNGREVISLGYPEGHAGKVTQAFADAVVEKGDLSYHTQFFKEAINALTHGELEVWGLSTGAAIVAEILSDPEFQQKVSNAVLISPAGSVEQTQRDLHMGFLKDMRSFIHNVSDIVPSFVWFSGKKGEKDTIQQNLFGKINGALQKAVSHKSPHWESMAVKDGGHIIVIAGGKDEVTKSYAAVDEFQKNPYVKVAVMPNETHITSFNSPQVLNKISELQSP